FGIGDVGQIDGRTRREFDRFATQATSDRHFVDAERGAITGAGDLNWMGADRDRNRQVAPCVPARVCWDRFARVHPGDPLAQLSAWLKEMAGHLAAPDERGC